MTKLPVSVCIIAKNEEAYIEQNLRHLVPYGMEMIVVDTGSEDKTKEIAKKYTDKVFDFTWTQDFSEARNFAAAKASYHWILVLDCDECLMELDTAELRRCMQKHNRHVGMLKLHHRHTQENGEICYQVDEVPRFYNKNFFEYRFSIHEQITPLHQEKLEEVRLLTFPLPAKAEHYGYDLTPEEMQKKQERNLSMLQAAVGKTPYLEDYLQFQIGQSFVALHRLEQAADAYQKAIALNQDFEKGFMKIAVVAYAKTLEKLGRFEEELTLLLQFEKKMQGAEYSFLLACAYQANGKHLEALLTFVKITQMADFDTLGERAYDTFVNIMQLHSAAGNKEGLLHFRERLEQYGLAHGRKIVFQ